MVSARWEPFLSTYLKALQLRRNVFFRKGQSLVLKAPRLINRYLSSPEDYMRQPPVLINSIPKSGTHLLLKLAESLPNTKNYKQFAAQVGSVKLRLRSDFEVSHSLSWICPGEVVGAHLHYSLSIEDLIRELNIIHLFLIRDPRDIAVSSVHYFDKMVYWNKVSRHIKSLATFDDKLIAVIEGIPELRYPSLEQRLSPYLSWMNSGSSHLIRFEDARQSPEAVASRALNIYLRHTTIPKSSIITSATELTKALNDTNSHTFRTGSINSWKENFSPRISRSYEAVCGDLAARMGY